MCKRRAIITIINSVDPTVIEFNEFVLYRARNFPEEQHYFISLGPAQSRFVQECRSQGAPYNIEVFECGGQYFKLKSVLNQILAKLEKDKIPVIVHLSQPRSAVAAQFLSFLFLRNVPTIFTLHSKFDLYVLPTKILTTTACLFASDITCVSQSSYEAFPNLMKWLKRKHTHLIVNGADLDRIDRVMTGHSKPAASAAGPPDTFRLLNVGRLVPAKNQVSLLEVLSQLPRNITLTIVGDGSMRSKLKSLADKLDITHRLRLTGTISREKVFSEMLHSDLFVSSSIREGLPIAVLEAMAMKMPVVLSDIEPHREIAQWGPSVKIISANLEEWVKYIKSFIATSTEKRSCTGQQNREIVEYHFSLARMHSEYTQLYNTLWCRSQ